MIWIRSGVDDSMIKESGLKIFPFGKSRARASKMKR